MKTDYIYGRNAVESYLFHAPSLVEKVFLNKNSVGRNIEKIQDIIHNQGIEIEYVGIEFFKKKFKQNEVHQGIVAVVQAFQYQSLDAFLNSTKVEENPTVLILDQVQDPRNLGAIIRTAVCAGMSAIMITTHESCDVNATVIKASTGAVFEIPIIQIINVQQTLKKLKVAGFWICSLDMEGATNYRTSKYDLPLCVVIGGEHRGIRPIVKKEVDFQVFIPMEKATVNSLNVSVASALIMYEIAMKKQGY